MSTPFSEEGGTREPREAAGTPLCLPNCPASSHCRPFHHSYHYPSTKHGDSLRSRAELQLEPSVPQRPGERNLSWIKHSGLFSKGHNLLLITAAMTQTGGYYTVARDDCGGSWQVGYYLQKALCTLCSDLGHRWWFTIYSALKQIKLKELKCRS